MRDRVTSPFDSPVNRGNLCVKGCFGYDFIDSPKRVTMPLIRETPDEIRQMTRTERRRKRK